MPSSLIPTFADLPLEEKAAFLKETRHAFGRTALLLRCVCRAPAPPAATWLQLRSGLNARRKQWPVAALCQPALPALLAPQSSCLLLSLTAAAAGSAGVLQSATRARTLLQPHHCFVCILLNPPKPTHPFVYCSGGGSLGAFHLGVVKALLEHQMLPRVLAGSSVGSVGELAWGPTNGAYLWDRLLSLLFWRMLWVRRQWNPASGAAAGAAACGLNYW